MALPRCDTWPHAVKTPIRRTAIDMNVSGMIGKTILSKDGTKVKIKAASDLYPVGASYGVHKLESDPPHWSADGH